MIIHPNEIKLILNNLYSHPFKHFSTLFPLECWVGKRGKWGNSLFLLPKGKCVSLCRSIVLDFDGWKEKLRHDIIYSSLSLRLSKSLIHCALILVQRMWPSLLNAGCKFQFCDKKTICIKQGKLYLCWNADYAKLSRDVPISRIFFIFNTSACNQV